MERLSQKIKRELSFLPKLRYDQAPWNEQASSSRQWREHFPTFCLVPYELVVSSFKTQSANASNVLRKIR